MTREPSLPFPPPRLFPRVLKSPATTREKPEHEKQKAQRGTRVETIGRPGGAAAAPLGVRPGGVFSPAAAQPTRREAAASLFYSVARSRRMPFLRDRTQSGAELGGRKRASPG